MIALGADHGGYSFKEDIKKYLDELGLEYKDFGTFSPERTDYPIYSSKVAEAIQSGECDKGILACRSGYGMTIVANKYKGVRCATCYNEETARHAKSNDNVNVIALPGDYIDISDAVVIIRTWLGTEFLGGRYEERQEMIRKIEDENFK